MMVCHGSFPYQLARQTQPLIAKALLGTNAFRRMATTLSRFLLGQRSRQPRMICAQQKQLVPKFGIFNFETYLKMYIFT